MWRKGGDDDDDEEEEEEDPSGSSRWLWRDRPKANAKEVQDPTEADGHLAAGSLQGMVTENDP